MLYHLSRQSIASQFIEIRLELQCSVGETVQLQLPAWRPGRYELANFAQKIRGFSVSIGQKEVTWQKITKDLWSFGASTSGLYQVNYSFCCNQMDAGGCWSDDAQLFINFSNLVFEIKGRENEEILVQIELPKEYQTATALPQIGANEWKANSHVHLMDSPLLASGSLKHTQFSIDSTVFHLWFNGEVHFDMEGLAGIFKNFASKQIEDFGEFPAQSYHFIFQLLPYRHYHGVEHSFSTVITIGPANSLIEKAYMDDLIGVSSHELYHFWNVCRIRPLQILPYDLSRETYLETGFIMEGVTTYFGDIYLLRSGYFSLEEYLTQLTALIQKEFDSFGWQIQSILESSFDLWLDGYKAGIPDKKVSIYNRGALIACCLDLMLMDVGSSLADVMKMMWEKFGKTQKGYKLADFEDTLMEASKNGPEILDFLQKVVYGKDDLLPILAIQLRSIGITIIQESNPERLAGEYGIKLQDNGEVSQVHPESMAYKQIMIKDKIPSLFLDGEAPSGIPSGKEVVFQIERWGRSIEIALKPEKRQFYPIFSLKTVGENEKRRKWSR